MTVFFILFIMWIVQGCTLLIILGNENYEITFVISGGSVGCCGLRR
jgi:hypothetical protein